MIPSGLTDENFRQAADRIDREGVRPGRESVHYEVEIQGKRYPPKYVISLATQFATGKEHSSDDFNAVEAKKHFEGRGYLVIDRRAEAATMITSEDDESAFPEGRESFALHRRLERDGSLVKRAKARRLADSECLECECCGFDFVATYGPIGTGFIEAHHKKPVSRLDGTETTKISDLALVCSNCHRMLHRMKDSTVEGLKLLLGVVQPVAQAPDGL